MSMEKKAYDVDVESGDSPAPAHAHAHAHGHKLGAPVYVDETGAVAAENFVVGDTWYHRTQRFASKFNIEARGIERVPENERTDKNLRKVGTMVRTAVPFKMSRREI
jgi:hypothetical protein